MNEGIDEICKGRLLIVPSVDVGVGHSRFAPVSWPLLAVDRESRSGSTSLYTSYDTASGWRVSPEQSAGRALAVLAFLQVLARDASEYMHNLLSTDDTKSVSIIRSKSRCGGCVCVLRRLARGSSRREVPQP